MLLFGFAIGFTADSAVGFWLGHVVQPPTDDIMQRRHACRERYAFKRMDRCQVYIGESVCGICDAIVLTIC